MTLLAAGPGHDHHGHDHHGHDHHGHDGDPATRDASVDDASRDPARLVRRQVGLVLVASALLGAVVTRGPVDVVAAVLVIAAALLLMETPRAMCLVAVALVPITSGLARGFPVPGVRVSEGIIAATVVVVYVLNRPRRQFRWGAVDVLAFSYAAGCMIFGLFDIYAMHTEPLRSDGLETVLGPFQFFALYRCVATQLTSADVRVLAQRCILIASVPVSALGIAQRIGPSGVQSFLVKITGTGIFNTPGYHPVQRVTSVFSIAHTLGGYLMLPTLLAVALLLEPRQRVLERRWIIAILALALPTMLLTLTFTIVLSLVAGVVALGVWYQRPGMILGVFAALAVSAVAALPLINARIAEQAATTSQGGSTLLPQTLAYRIDVWTSQYLPALSGHYVTGFGPSIPNTVVWQHTESGYLTLILRGGIPYLLLGIALVAAFFKLAARAAATSTGETRALARVTAVVVVLLLPMDFIFPYFTASGLPQILWVFWGLLVAAQCYDAPARALAAVPHAAGVPRGLIARRGLPSSGAVR